MAAPKSKVKFAPELFDEICNEIAYSSKGLVTICNVRKINACTFYEWISNDKELANKYARARELQAEFLADEIMEISDDGKNDTYLSEEGVPLTNYDVIARSKLRVDARKWKASKLAPKKYGEKIEHDVNANVSIAPRIILDSDPEEGGS